MFPQSYPKLVETCSNPVLQHSLTIKARDDVRANKCGSFENEALENEDRSTKHPNLEDEAP